MKRHLILLVSTLALLGTSAFAQTTKVPALINYQGNVRSATGTPLSATRTVTFRFYKSPTSSLAADRLWSESQSVTIVDGNFSVLIGGGTVVLNEANTGTFAEVFGKSTSVYLSITVDDGTSAADPEISPRQQIVTTAFAFRATVAEKVDDAAVTGPMIAANAVTTTQLNASAVTAEKIATSAVTSTQILDGTIATADIADSSITRAKILDGTIATADMADSAITTAKILDGTIATADLADNSVTSAKIVNATVTGTDIAAGTITDANLGTNTATTVENLKIIRGTVNGEGVLISGTGFTPAPDGAFVKVTFPAGTFSSIPTVVVSPWNTSAGWTQYVTNITNTSFQSAGAFSGVSGGSRQNFTFIAIGPR